MKIEEIIKHIDNNTITELRELLIQELYMQNAPQKDIFKAQVKLSKLAEKEQRQGKKENGEPYYMRPMIAGAYHLNGTTMICNGVWGVIYNTIINGLVEIKDTTSDKLDLNRVFPNDTQNYEKVDFNINTATNDIKLNKEHRTKIGNDEYPTTQIVNIYNSLENCVITTDPLNERKPILLVGENGKAIILPLYRKN